MLSAAASNAQPEALARVEARVRALVAETAGYGAGDCALLEAALDSLTLLAIVTRLEVAFGIAFDSDETVALLAARDIRALAAFVARKVTALEAKIR